LVACGVRLEVVTTGALIDGHGDGEG